jgi:hypothetical protein
VRKEASPVAVAGRCAYRHRVEGGGPPAAERLHRQALPVFGPDEPDLDRRVHADRGRDRPGVHRGIEVDDEARGELAPGGDGGSERARREGGLRRRGHAHRAGGTRDRGREDHAADAERQGNPGRPSTLEQRRHVDGREDGQGENRG